jgi:hypothetical protein
MSIDDIARFIAQVGFPVSVSIYLMVIHDYRLQQIVKELKKLNLKR